MVAVVSGARSSLRPSPSFSAPFFVAHTSTTWASCFSPTTTALHLPQLPSTFHSSKGQLLPSLCAMRPSPSHHMRPNTLHHHLPNASSSSSSSYHQASSSTSNGIGLNGQDAMDKVASASTALDRVMGLLDGFEVSFRSDVSSALGRQCGCW